MDRKYNKKSVDYAKELRSNHGLVFMVASEKASDMSVYCAQANLVIELDGSQHFKDEGMSYDKEREKYLAGYGIKIVRIPNNEVWNNFRGICLYIDGIVKEILKNT